MNIWHFDAENSVLSEESKKEITDLMNTFPFFKIELLENGIMQKEKECAFGFTISKYNNNGNGEDDELFSFEVCMDELEDMCLTTLRKIRDYKRVYFDTWQDRSKDGIIC